jgi:hypothetical protein
VFVGKIVCVGTHENLRDGFKWNLL